MTSEVLRVDKWLWYARFCKSRSLATRLCSSGRLRINSSLTNKAHFLIRPGDVLTFPQGPYIRVVRIIALGSRRGPAIEARTLYEDLQPPDEEDKLRAGSAPAVARRDPGSGRPTKVERRAIDRLRREH